MGSAVQAFPARKSQPLAAFRCGFLRKMISDLCSYGAKVRMSSRYRSLIS